jgi:hypothetical protein
VKLVKPGKPGMKNALSCGLFEATRFAASTGDRDSPFTTAAPNERLNGAQRSRTVKNAGIFMFSQLALLA